MRSGRMGRDRSRSSPGAALAAALVAGLALGAPARAQEPPGQPAPYPRAPYLFFDSERPVLGVYLSERCEPPGPAERPCAEPPVVRAVESGGPADRAGVHPGDTLLAVDGERLNTPEGRRRLRTLEQGRPVSLTLGRAEGGPRTVRVSPEVMGPARTKRLRTFSFGPDALAFAPPRAGALEFEVVELPKFAGRVAAADSLMLRLDSLHAALVVGQAPDGAVVYVLGDDAENVGIGAWRADSLRILVGTEPRGEMGTRAGARGARATDVKVRMRAPRHAHGAYVWENPDLARRLEVVRDSVGRAVRVRLESLRHLRPAWSDREAFAAESLHVHFEGLLRSPREAGPEAAVRAAPRASASEVEALLVTDARTAGAEFAPLTPGLAENFPGVSRGLLVLRVLPGTPAARLGLRDGDVVVEADGIECGSVAQLRGILTRGVREGRGTSVKWVRKGQARTGVLAGP